MKNLNQALLLAFLVIASALAVNCGGGETPNPQQNGASQELTKFQLEHGIGPITQEVRLGPINQQWVEKGKGIFNMKCAACHQMEGRFVGPPLGNVTNDRSAAYIMNMILNPGEMTKKHPEAKRLLADYLSIMPFQNVTEPEARSIVEYLRTQAPKK